MSKFDGSEFYSAWEEVCDKEIISLRDKYLQAWLKLKSPEPKQQTKGKNDKETNDSGSSGDVPRGLGQT